MLLQERVFAVAEAQRGGTAYGQVVMLTIADLIERLVQDYEIQGRKSTAEMLHHIKPVLRILGEIRADTLSTDNLRRYIRIRQEAGRANGTINRETAALRRAYNLAFQEGLLAGVPHFVMLKETGIRQGTYTREEMERLVPELPEHLRAVAWFAYHTGRRRGEILQITWDDVNLKEGWIRIRAGTVKTGQPDKIPLTGELLALIQGLSSGSPMAKGAFLFQYKGKAFRTFRMAWKRACIRAGLQDRLFHDMRRTVATDLIEAGVSEKTAMAVTGHKTRHIFQRYQIVHPGEVKNALEQLERHRKNQQ